jgi:hypothetical protein
MNKKDLSERDICSKFIGPAIKRAGTAQPKGPEPRVISKWL